VLLLLLGKVGPQRLLLRGVLENKTGGWEWHCTPWTSAPWKASF
jgi:hypothetical protein